MIRFFTFTFSFILFPLPPSSSFSYLFLHFLLFFLHSNFHSPCCCDFASSSSLSSLAASFLLVLLASSSSASSSTFWLSSPIRAAFASFFPYCYSCFFSAAFFIRLPLAPFSCTFPPSISGFTCFCGICFFVVLSVLILLLTHLPLFSQHFRCSQERLRLCSCHW